MGKNVLSVGEGCNHMSLKEEKVNFPRVAIREDKVTGEGDTDKRRKSTGKTDQLCGAKKKPTVIALFWLLPLGISQSRAVASRGKEEDIMLLPSHRPREAIIGTWYSN